MPLTVVIAPDSLKGSLSAREAATAIGAGWAEERPTDMLLLVPQADGGEGTVDALESATVGSVRRSAGVVEGPDGRPVEGEWLSLPDGTAVIELAQSSGLPLLDSLDPLGSSTVGLGQVVSAALDDGAHSIVIGLGGSASTDGGAGALTALGLRLLDAEGRDLPRGGVALERLRRVDRSSLRAAPAGGIRLLTDVDAPLLGETGAAAVFGPQKGADPADVARLDRALTVLASVLVGDPTAPGSGAAGGSGYGFQAALGATLVSGADTVAELSGLTDALAEADVVITGEGRFDRTSLGGKVVGRILDRIVGRDIRTIVVAGSIASDLPGEVVNRVTPISLTEIAGSTAAAMADPVGALRTAGRLAARCASVRESAAV